jgi:hypothetical protein
MAQHRSVRKDRFPTVSATTTTDSWTPTPCWPLPAPPTSQQASQPLSERADAQREARRRQPPHPPPRNKRSPGPHLLYLCCRSPRRQPGVVILRRYAENTRHYTGKDVVAATDNVVARRFLIPRTPSSRLSPTSVGSGRGSRGNAEYLTLPAKCLHGYVCRRDGRFDRRLKAAPWHGHERRE